MLSTVLIALSGSAIAQSAGSATTPSHPKDKPSSEDATPRLIISEVLFNVPKGSEGDANGDGIRSATGDEFVEVFNASDKPVQLKGYRLRDGAPTAPKKDSSKSSDAKKTEKNQDNDAQSNEHENVPFDFTFPELELAPGKIAVVFNGYESNITGEVGTTIKAAEPNDKFHGAFIFNAEMASSYAAFSNTHDLVQLISPEGNAVETVTWDYRDNDKGGSSQGGRGARGGDSKAKPSDRQQDQRYVSDKHGEKAGGVVRSLPTIRLGSAQIRTVKGEFFSHISAKGAAFSPGEFSPENEAKTPKDASKKSNPDD